MLTRHQKCELPQSTSLYRTRPLLSIMKCLFFMHFHLLPRSTLRWKNPYKISRNCLSPCPLPADSPTAAHGKIDKNKKRFAKTKKRLDFPKNMCYTINAFKSNLGVAQLVARYLGVVEAASSSLVTQTKIGGSIEPPIFFYFLANPR